jgi:hypothetical protein
MSVYMRYIASLLLLVVCSASVVALATCLQTQATSAQRGDVDFSLRGPWGIDLKEVCQSDELTCTYTLKGYIDGMMFHEDKEACEHYSSPIEGYTCFQYYFTGLSDGQLIVSMEDKLCLPESVSLPKAKSIVSKYLSENPKSIYLPGAYLTYLALSTAFPCSNK